ncbi:transcription repressor NadR [Lacticaseibacillus sharpeae]|uniref:Small molecule binding protein n=1 Tax=Lacticaseibacillus sharpeae JCM 1186 = DSM 20505 TaxID=1291052 RepID=A0A0R1ZJ33_9LACO|nr:transcription repressor NadR [Lacticaseibacillus sharpeae]KRM54942.1 small molecule binding protein [Lacticaseibacillus sharpeae JCM 1186 = DSM 20505]
MTNHRQTQIKAQLMAADTPVSATTLAKKYNVSRQTIVGDVALMRALGEKIIATPRGYEYERPSKNEALLVCKHLPVDAADEMRRIVHNGGVIKDVIVDHPLYGQLRGTLLVRTDADINMFTAKMKLNKGRMLSELTGGVHMHTVAYDQQEDLTAIKAALRDAGYLVE